MKVSLFSQSLFAFGLSEAIAKTAEIGFPAIELACASPHFMRQLTDTLASSQRLMRMTPADVVGMTVDFLNLAFAGEKMADVVWTLKDRMYHTHIKNGYVDSEGRWHFRALDEGLIDYLALLKLLRDVGYTGYLSIECLGPQAAEMPEETARRDLEILERYLTEGQP